MKRVLKHLIIVVPLFILCFFLIFSFADKTKTVSEKEIEYHPRVYVTTYGDKYHSTDCHYLHSSKIAKSLTQAQTSGYTACSYCHGEPNGTIAVEKTVFIEVDDTPTAQKRSLIYASIATLLLYWLIWAGLSFTNYYGHKESKESQNTN